MGHQANVKLLRKQLRNICQEILPEVLTNEMVKAQTEGVITAMNGRLDKITEHIQQTLDQVDQRSKDVQSYIVRQSAASAPQIPQAEETKTE